MKRRGNPNRQAAFKHAFSGMAEVFRDEPNTRIHLVGSLLAVAFGLWFRLAPLEWSAIAIAIGMVWTAELLNTAIEAAVDMITEEYDERARKAKDLAAGGVLTAAATAVCIGLLVFGPKLLALL
jgi:diacylglycerol kinase